MSSGNLASINPNEYKDALVKGVVLTDMPEENITQSGILSVFDKTYAGDYSEGRWIANLSEPPGYTETDEMAELFSDLYGKTGDMVGDTLVRSIRNEATVSITSLSPENMKFIRPDLEFELIYDGAVAASTTRGTTDSQITITAKQAGTAGNSIRYAHVVAGNSTPLTVSVSGNDITVNVATSGTGAATSTANDVATAINTNVAASALVSASIPGGTTGADVVSASAMASLTAGAAGTNPIAIKSFRTLKVDPSQHKTLILGYSTPGHIIGKAVVLKNAKSVTEDKEYSLDADMTVQGIETTLRAHSTAADMNLMTGQVMPAAYELDFTRTAIPAALQSA